MIGRAFDSRQRLQFVAHSFNGRTPGFQSENCGSTPQCATNPRVVKRKSRGSPKAEAEVRLLARGPFQTIVDIDANVKVATY